jgi:Na+-driven multidrug efflux pump
MNVTRQRSIVEGPLRGAVFWLALPVLGEQALNACVTWNDAYLAGRISPVATGAVGIAGYVSWLMTMIFWMVDTGATAIVARAVGAGNVNEAKRTTHQALTLAIVLGMSGTIAVGFAAPLLAALLNMRGTAAQVGVDFMRIETLGYAGAAISFAMTACMRGAGDTRTPMVIMGGVNIVNIALTWLLAHGWGPIPSLGTSGIAWGTVAARWAGAVWILILMFPRAPRMRVIDDEFWGFMCAVEDEKRASSRDTRSRKLLALDVSLLKPDRSLISRILSIGIPAALDGVLAFSGHFIFMILVTRVPSEFPTSVLYAAHIVGIRIESLSYLPANAWAMAAAAMVGQNLGARQPDRARRAANEAARQAMAMLGLTGLLYFFAAEPLYRLLSNDPEVWRCGVPALKGLACVQIPLAVLIVYLGSLRGAGDTRVPILITAVGMAVVRIPVAWFGGWVLRAGLVGAWMGMYADITIRAGLLAWRFRQGGWRKISV